MALLSAKRQSAYSFLLLVSLITTMRAQALVLQRLVPFELPVWAQGYFANPPANRLPLGNLPTPLYQLHPFLTTSSKSLLQTLTDKGISLFVKRDDMSGGVETGGK